MISLCFICVYFVVAGQHTASTQLCVLKVENICFGGGGGGGVQNVTLLYEIKCDPLLSPMKYVLSHNFGILSCYNLEICSPCWLFWYLNEDCSKRITEVVAICSQGPI